MPTYDASSDAHASEPADAVYLDFATPLQVERIVVEHGRVGFWQGDGEVAWVTKPTHPGAGIALDIADSAGEYERTLECG